MYLWIWNLGIILFNAKSIYLLIDICHPLYKLNYAHLLIRLRMKWFSSIIHIDIYLQCQGSWVHRSWPFEYQQAFVSHYLFSLWLFYPLQDSQVYLVFWFALYCVFDLWFSGSGPIRLISSLPRSSSLIVQFVFASRFNSCSPLFRFLLVQQGLIASQRIVFVWQLRDQLGFFLSFVVPIALFLWLVSHLPRKLSWL